MRKQGRKIFRLLLGGGGGGIGDMVHFTEGRPRFPLKASALLGKGGAEVEIGAVGV